MAGGRRCRAGGRRCRAGGRRCRAGGRTRRAGGRTYRVRGLKGLSASGDETAIEFPTVLTCIA